MKHLTTILAAVLCAVCLSGCEDTNHLGVGFGDRIIIMKHNGHSYIIYKGPERGGITHDPDCPCHKEGGEE